MQNTAAVFLTFFVLALAYTCFLIYTVLRICQSKKFISDWKYAKLIYYFQGIQLLLRATSFWLICVFNSRISSDEELSFLSLSLPDSLIIASFIVLFWIMITCTMHTRIDSECQNCSGNDLLRAGKITLITLVVWLVLQGFLYVFLFFQLISTEVIVMVMCVWSFLTGGIVLIGLIVVQVKYSGLPFKTEQAGKFLKTVLFVTFVWIVGRFSHGVLYLLRESSLDNKNETGMDDTFGNTTTIIMIIVDLLMTELMCYYFILDYSFFRIFLHDFINDSPISSYLNSTDGISLLIGSNEETQNTVKTHTIEQRKGKMGSLYIKETNDFAIAIRKIILPRVNKYVLENVQSDIERQQALRIPFFLPPISYNYQKTELEIITRYFESGSLYSVLHEKKYEFSMFKKLEIALKIAGTLSGIHASGLCHGHLTSHNILLSSQYEPYISDLGFDHLKKYCGVIIGYCNKSSWSSPEILKEHSMVVTKATSSDDIYSFGIILWELIFQQEPFPGYSLSKLRETVGEQGYRPGMLPCEYPEITELLRLCWNKDPANRPDLDLIEKKLIMISNNLELDID